MKRYQVRIIEEREMKTQKKEKDPKRMKRAIFNRDSYKNSFFMVTTKTSKI